MNRLETLKLASDAVGQRHENYNLPETSFEQIARLWNAHLENTSDVHGGHGVYFDSTDVAIMLSMVKIARVENDPAHLDSWVDIAGYAACGAEVSKAGKPLPGEFLHFEMHPGETLQQAADRALADWRARQ